MADKRITYRCEPGAEWELWANWVGSQQEARAAALRLKQACVMKEAAHKPWLP